MEDVKLNKAEFKLMIETIPGERGWVMSYFSKAFTKWGKEQKQDPYAALEPSETPSGPSKTTPPCMR